MTFHITKHGDVALCNATVRACPLGEGSHFDSAEEANAYTLEQAMAADMAAFEEEARLTDEAMDEWAGALELEAGDAPLTPEEEALAFDADDDDIATMLDQWEAEEFMDELRWESGMEDWPDPDAALLTAEEEAAAVVKERQRELYRSMPTEWGTALLDSQVSEAAAAELGSYKGYKALDLLATDLEEAARQQHGQGLLSDRELEEELETVAMIRFLINPSEGRRGTGPREPRPLDPELIQALRCLYIKRFGVDPFEQGVTVVQLLQMRQQRLI